VALRIGFDMDGVLANFSAAYDEIGLRMSGSSGPAAGKTENTEAAPLSSWGFGRRHDDVWKAIRKTPDFWTTLSPLEPDAISRIHEMVLRHPWEVFFITRRPSTAGETVQRQTQRWLVRHGFDYPSVVVIRGSRGLVAGALRLDYHVDDTLKNCIDVKAKSDAKPILVVPSGDKAAVSGARKLGIGTARTMTECLDVLEQATTAQTQPKLLERIATLVSWH
jgi:hypothetical protein